MTKPPEDDKRRFRASSLAQLVPGLTRAAYRRRSPAGAAVMADWAAIVGPALAARTEPRRLSGTTLTIACAGPVALELQHMTETLRARINGQAGRVLVETIRFVQAPISPRDAPPPAPPPAPPQPIPGFPPGELHDALARLHAALRSRRKSSP